MTAQSPAPDAAVLAKRALAPTRDERIFPALLAAMARPADVIAVRPLADAPPAPLYSPTAAMCRNLAEFEKPLWVDGAVAVAARTVNYLKFHCACPITNTPDAARTALLADPMGSGTLARFFPGTEERPETSATVIIQVAHLQSGSGRRIEGPHIDGIRRLHVDGVPEEFWTAIAQNHRLSPRGIDIVLCAPSAIACLPRTVRAQT